MRSSIEARLEERPKAGRPPKGKTQTEDPLFLGYKSKQ